ncbi:hypothetical protein [Streptomyces cyaneofuscatus]|uniref:hypothetical protein n=1 Tax=Streptomyces cyaneofuscatus TaxID=66883 RepID=UPI00364FBCE5
MGPGTPEGLGASGAGTGSGADSGTRSGAGSGTRSGSAPARGCGTVTAASRLRSSAHLAEARRWSSWAQAGASGSAGSTPPAPAARSRSAARPCSRIINSSRWTSSWRPPGRRSWAAAEAEYSAAARTETCWAKYAP